MIRKLLAIVGLVAVGIGVGLLVRPAAQTPVSQALSQPAQQPLQTQVPEGIAIGQRAPDFALQDLSGKTVHLSDLRGKPVFINFWATWCPPCRAEMPEIQKLYSEHGNEFYMVGIDLTTTEKSPSTVPAFLKQNGYNFPVLLDPTETVVSRYAVRAVPTSFFLDKNGIIRVVWPGPMDAATMASNLAKALAGGQ